MFKVKQFKVDGTRRISELQLQTAMFESMQHVKHFNEAIQWGYLGAEDPNRVDTEEDPYNLLPFDLSNPEHLNIATSNSLYYNFIAMKAFCEGGSSSERAQIKEKYPHVFDGACGGGLWDLCTEVIGPLMTIEYMARLSPLNYGPGTDALFHLLYHFLAAHKLEFGPSFSNHLEYLDLEEDCFTFRELTLLAGHKNERSIRNEAIKTNPDALKTFKRGHRTFISIEEARRWLKSQDKWHNDASP